MAAPMASRSSTNAAITGVANRLDQRAAPLGDDAHQQVEMLVQPP